MGRMASSRDWETYEQKHKRTVKKLCNNDIGSFFLVEKNWDKLREANIKNTQSVLVPGNRSAFISKHSTNLLEMRSQSAFSFTFQTKVTSCHVCVNTKLVGKNRAMKLIQQRQALLTPIEAQSNQVQVNCLTTSSIFYRIRIATLKQSPPSVRYRRPVIHPQYRANLLEVYVGYTTHIWNIQ